MAVLLLATAAAATRITLTTTTTLPGVTPERSLSYLSTPKNWPELVLSSWSVRGDGVDQPFQPGQSVDEIFGLPPILPLEVCWTCTEVEGRNLVFDSSSGLDGIASDCRMAFTVDSDGTDGSNVELVMSYEPQSPLAALAQPILAVDNAIALKLSLPAKLSPLGSSDPIAGPLVAFARRTGLLPAAEADGWTGEPTAWAEYDSTAQQLSELTQRYLGDFKQFTAELVAGEFDAVAVDQSLEDAIGKGGVTVFAFGSCPFCKKARALLDSKGARYDWILLDERDDGAAMRARLGKRTGRTSVPSVWIDQEYVGGLNDGCPGLVPLDQRGELEPRLQAAGAIGAV